MLLLNNYIHFAPSLQLGVSKVFMRKHAHEWLEAHRTFNQKTASILLQSFLRAAILTNLFKIHKNACSILQRVFRGTLGRRKWTRLNQLRAASLLSKNLLMFVKRAQFRRKKAASTKIQRTYLKWRNLKLISAVKLSAWVRGRLARVKLTKFMRSVIVLQNRYRRKRAKLRLSNLKMEMKSVSSLKSKNEEMKSEMAALKAMLKMTAEKDKRETEKKEDESELKLLRAKSEKLEQQQHNNR